jgi:hypothetical protein
MEGPNQHHETTVPTVRSTNGVADGAGGRGAHDRDGQCWRSYGNELWEFTDDGLMARREASINDIAIEQGDRRIHGPRPDVERGQQLPIL